jgi:hypothetical protein
VSDIGPSSPSESATAPGVNEALTSSATQQGSTPTQQVAFSTGRNIGGFIADVTISEEHTDEVTVTDHPVEQGANISDHAFANPVRVVIRVGYSNSSQNAGANSAYVNQQYQNFIDLKNTRQPFAIITGRRNYSNMVIIGLALTTDETTANAMILTVTCREVIIVSTQTATVPPADQHANPQATGPVTNQGTVTPVPASPNTSASILA